MKGSLKYYLQYDFANDFKLLFKHKVESVAFPTGSNEKICTDHLTLFAYLSRNFLTYLLLPG